MSAKKNQIFLLRQLLCHALRKGSALRCHENHARMLRFRQKALIGIINRLSLHHKPCAAAIGIIVHMLMLILREIADIHRLYGNMPFLLRSAHNTV